MAKNTRPKDTSANRARTDKNPAFQRFGKSNGAHKGGNSPHAYRLKAKAKPGEVVHHKNRSQSQSGKSNLQVLKGTKTMSAMGRHNQIHGDRTKTRAKK